LLYERIYQRPPKPEEVKLGLEFITEKPEPEPVAVATAQPVSNDSDPRKRAREKQLAKKMARGREPVMKKREPLKIWEEYTHALLQANETSFVN
jgi:hypothetical protein